MTNELLRDNYYEVPKNTYQHLLKRLNIVDQAGKWQGVFEFHEELQQTHPVDFSW